MKRLLFIISLSICASLYAQPKVRLETIFAINDDKTSQREYLFKEVAGIITDEANNFYVYENFGTEIRKFSKDGKYIKTIGREGAGPGEFKSISQPYINLHNLITVHDPKNYRISFFDLNGRYQKSEFCKSGTQYMKKIIKYNSDSYIALRSVNNSKLEHGNKIIILDKNLKNIVTSFGYSSIFWKYNDVFELNMDIWNALGYTFTANNVFVVKEYYDGKLYIFNKNKNWEVNIVEGSPIKMPGYEIIEKPINEMDWKSIVGGNICFGEEWGGKRRVFTIIYQYSSIGLYTYKDKYLLNFLVKCIKAREYELGVDIFNLDGNYIGYSKIEWGNKVGIRDEVFCKDKDDNFYMRTNGEEIRKIKLTIE